jgi:hypothetical protein
MTLASHHELFLAVPGGCVAEGARTQMSSVQPLVMSSDKFIRFMDKEFSQERRIL